MLSMLFVDYFFYSLVQESKRMCKMLKRDSKLIFVNELANKLRRVEGTRGVRERREEVSKEVVGHCLFDANLGARDGGAG